MLRVDDGQEKWWRVWLRVWFGLKLWNIVVWVRCSACHRQSGFDTSDESMNIIRKAIDVP